MSQTSHTDPQQTPTPAHSVMSVVEFLEALRRGLHANPPALKPQVFQVAAYPGKVEAPKHNNLSYFDHDGIRLGLFDLSRRLSIHLDIQVPEDKQDVLEKLCHVGGAALLEFHVLFLSTGKKPQISLWDVGSFDTKSAEGVAVTLVENSIQMDAADSGLYSTGEEDSPKTKRAAYDDMLLGRRRS